MEGKITAITASPVTTGLGLYAQEVSEVLHGNILSLVRDRNMLSAQFVGEMRRAAFYPPVTTGWTINRNFPRFMFGLHGLKNSWVHYCNPMIPVNNLDKRIVTFHDFFFGFPEEKPHRYDRRVIEKFRECPNVISVSHHTAEMANNYGLRQEFAVIHSAGGKYKKLPFAERRQEFSNKKVILSVGISLPRKNTGMIRKVMLELDESYILIRVGKPIGVRGEVVYDHPDFETLNYLYNISDVLFFPSHDEGFGYPPVEALKVGLPSVVSDIDIFHETMRDAVVYVNRNSISSCLAGIKEAIENREEIEKKQAPLRKYYSQERFTKEMQDFYESRTGLDILANQMQEGKS